MFRKYALNELAILKSRCVEMTLAKRRMIKSEFVLQNLQKKYARKNQINEFCIFASSRFIKSNPYTSKIDDFRLILLLLRVGNHQYCAVLLHNPEPAFSSSQRSPTRLASSWARAHKSPAWTLHPTAAKVRMPPEAGKSIFPAFSPASRLKNL